MIATKPIMQEAIRNLRDARYEPGCRQNFDKWLEQRRENLKTLEELYREHYGEAV